MTSVNISTTKNTVTVDEDNPSVITVATLGPQGPAVPDGDKGDITVSNNGTVMTVDAGVINNAKIASDAAIALSKLATGALPTAITVTSANISDLSILNADVNASAAIAGTKISPDFGSQNIVTTGNITIADVTAASLDISGGVDVDGTLEADAYTVNGTALNEYIADTVGAMVSGNTETNIAVTYDDADNTLDFSVVNITGNAASADTVDVGNTSSLDATRYLTFVDTDGSARSLNIDGSLFYNSSSNQLNVGTVVAGTFSGSGASLTALNADNISSGTLASARIEDSAITSAKIEDGAIVNADVNASAAIAGTKISPDFGSQNIVTTGTLGSGDITVSSSKPRIDLVDTNHNSDFYFINDDGTFAIKDSTNDAGRLVIASNGQTTIYGNCDFAAGIDVTGNITVTGTVDGRDVSADGTKLDGIEANAINASNTAVTNKLPLAGGTLNGDVRFNGSNVSNYLFWDKSADSLTLTNGTITATTFSGSGASLTSLPASQLTGAIANGVTATTQSASDNSTKVATTAYADTAIANLVDSSPSALNTLNELAAALGDDANFSTTVTNSIATKLPLAGGTLTGSLAGTSATFSGDVTANGGDMTISGDTAATLHLVDTTDNPNYRVQNVDGVFRIYDATVDTTRFSISTTGNATFAGDVTTNGDNSFNGTDYNSWWDKSDSAFKFDDNAKLKVGTGGDLQIYHSGDVSRIRNTNDSGTLKIQATSNGENAINIVPNGTTEIYYDGTKKLETTSTGVKISDAILEIADTSCLIDLMETSATNHRIRNGSGNFYIQRISDDKNTTTNQLLIDGGTGAVELYHNGSKKAQTYADGLNVLGDFWIDNQTNTGRDVWFDESADTFKFYTNVKATFGTGNELQIYHDGSHSYIANTTGNLYITEDGYIELSSANGGEKYATFSKDGAVELYYDNSLKIKTTTAGVQMPSGTYFQFDAASSHAWAIGATDGADLPANSGTALQFHYWNNTAWDKISYQSADGIGVPDSKKFIAGDSSDLQIYHDGSNSYIDDAGTGALIIKSSNLQVNNPANDENLIWAGENGAVELYYDSSKKLETSSTGGILRGTLWTAVDNTKIAFGTSDDLEIYHDGSHSYVDNTGTGHLYIKDAGAVKVRTASFGVDNADGSEAMIAATADGDTSLYYDGSQKFHTRTDGVRVLGDATWSDDGKARFGPDGDLVIYHNATNSEIKNITGLLYIESDGILITDKEGSDVMANFIHDGEAQLYYDNSEKLNTASHGVTVHGQLYATSSVTVPDSGILRCGAGNDLDIFHNGTNSEIKNITGLLYIESDGTWITDKEGSDKMAKFIHDGAVELYYDNSKKLETYSSGVQVTGTLFIPDGGSATNRIAIGDSGDLKLYHDTSNSIIETKTGNLIIKDTTADPYGVYIQSDLISFQSQSTSSNEQLAKFEEGGAVSLYYDNSKKLETTSAGVTLSDGLVFDNPTNAGKDIQWQPGSDRLAFFDNTKATFGDGVDLQIYFDGSNSYIKEPAAVAGQLIIDGWNGTDIRQGETGELMGRFLGGGAVELYYDNVEKLRTNPGGIKVTGNIACDGDNQKLILGAGDDLQIYHDGTNSIIEDVNDNPLWIQTDGAIRLTKDAAAAYYATFNPGGASELYYDGSLKLSTTSQGINLEGNGTDHYILDLHNTGSSKGSQIQFRNDHDASANIGLTGDTTGDLRIYTEKTFKVAHGTDLGIKSTKDGAVSLYYDNSKKLETKSYGIQVAGGVHIQSDSEKLWVGADSDLHIYHDGSDNFIKNAVSGRNLKITHSDDAVSATFYSTSVALNYSGTKKFETTSAGAKVSGDLEILGTADGDHATIYLTADQGSDTNDKWRLRASDGGHFYLQNFVAGAWNDTMLKASADANIQLYYDNSKKLETTSWGADVTGTLRADTLQLDGDDHKLQIGADQDWEIYHDGTDNYFQTGEVTTHFRTNNGNRLSIKSDGNVMMQGSGGKNLEFKVATGLLTFTDNTKATFGTGDDLQMWADGSNSYIQHSGDGDLFVQATGADENLWLRAKDDVNIQANDNENAALFKKNGAVELYYDGSKKIQTASHGIDVLDDLVFDNGTNAGRDINWSESTNTLLFQDAVYAAFGSSNDLKIHHDGANSYITESGTGELYIQGNTFVSIRDSVDGDTMAKFIKDGAVELYHNASKKLETTSGGAKVTGNLEVTSYISQDDSIWHYWGTGDDCGIMHDGSHMTIRTGTGNIRLEPKSGELGIQVIPDGAVEVYYDNAKKFETFSWGVQNYGHVALRDNDKHIIGDNSDLQLYHDGSNSFIKDAGTGSLKVCSNSFSFRNAADSEDCGHYVENGRFELYYDNSKKLETYTDGIKVYDDVWVADNGVIRCGTRTAGGGGDLHLYHSGSNSFIKHVGTGDLFIQCDDGEDIYLRPKSNEDGVKIVSEGRVELYYANTKKLETTSTGTKTTGRCHVTQATNDTDFTNESSPGFTNGIVAENTQATDGVWASLTALAYNAVTTNQSASFIAKSVASGYAPEIYITQRSGANAQSTALKVDSAGTIEFYHAGYKKFNTDPDGLIFGDGYKTLFGNDDDLTIYHDGSHSYIKNSTNYLLLESDQLQLRAANGETYFNGAANGVASLYWDDDPKFETSSNGATLTGQLLVNFNASQVAGANFKNANDTGTAVYFSRADGTVTGSISQPTTTSTAFNTSSDYRLKENEVSISDGIERLKTLKPYRFNFKETPLETVDGFFAHEVTPAVPEAITGEKDGVEMQQIDQSKLVPLLVASLQEAIAKIEVLETEVAALKAGS